MNTDYLKKQIIKAKRELDEMKREQLETGRYSRGDIKKKQTEFFRLQKQHQKLVVGF